MEIERIGHYRIVERLGSGAMGVVYRAEDTRLGRQVALKFLPPHLSNRAENKQRFMQEARAASAVDHPNLCPVYDIGETDDGQIYIAMPFYEGETLKSRLAAGPLPTALAIDLAIQLGEGLAAAQGRGIVHRDLKPANVIVTRDDRVKIVDFGLAKLLDETSATRSGAILGTVAYMSPEQARGEEIDHRTDLWSLGVILYEMLTGRPPFTGDHEAAALYAIVSRQPPLPSRAASAPPVLDGIVEKALTKERDARYQSAAEFVADLRTARVELGLASAEEISMVLPRVRRHRWRRRLGLAAVMIALTAGAVALLELRRPATASGNALAVLPFENLTGAGELDYLGDGLAAALTTSLGNLSGMQVVSRSEVARWQGEELGSEELARRLGVTALLEGDLLGTPGALRANVRLTDGATARVIWNQTFAGDTDHLMALQEEIEEAVVRFLSIPLTFAERRELAASPSARSRAFDSYLQGLARIDEVDLDPTNLELAISQLRRAVDLDPEFASAWAALSQAHLQRSLATADEAHLEQARAAASRALELAPDGIEGILALAAIEARTGAVEESMERVREVLSRVDDPGRAYERLANNHAMLGQYDQAIAFQRAAAEADPTDWRRWHTLGIIYGRAGRYDEARAPLQRAAELAPAGETLPQEFLALGKLTQGDFEGAIEAYEAIEGPTESASLASNLGTAYFFSDRADKWEQAERYYKLAIRLQPHDPLNHGNLGDLYAVTARAELARDEYRKAYELTEQFVRTNPHHQEVRLQQALYAAKAGECAIAVQQARRLQKDVSDGSSWVDLAFTFGQCEEREDTLHAIERAVALGQSPRLLEQAPEFQFLRGDPELTEILGSPPAGRS